MTENKNTQNDQNLDEATGKVDRAKLQEAADLDATAGGATPAAIIGGAAATVAATVTASATSGVCPTTACTSDC